LPHGTTSNFHNPAIEISFDDSTHFFENCLAWKIFFVDAISYEKGKNSMLSSVEIVWQKPSLWQQRVNKARLTFGVAKTVNSKATKQIYDILSPFSSSFVEVRWKDDENN
jgi:hypothetical protein